MKKFWSQTLPLIASGVIISGAGGAIGLILSEVKFHVQVNERLAAIESKLGITLNEKETHVADRN